VQRSSEGCNVAQKGAAKLRRVQRISEGSALACCNCKTGFECRRPMEIPPTEMSLEMFRKVSNMCFLREYWLIELTFY
jgi:hypothetical protein